MDNYNYNGTLNQADSHEEAIKVNGFLRRLSQNGSLEDTIPAKTLDGISTGNIRILDQDALLDTEEGSQGSNKTKMMKKKKKVRRQNRVLHFFLKLFLYIFSLLVVAFCALAVATAIYLAQVTVGDEELLDLNAIKLSYATRLMAEDPATGEWIEYQRIYGEENRVWVDYPEMTEELKNAVIASEDHGFMTHHGIDLKRTIAATLNMLLEEFGREGILSSSQGGSTLTQQLIKNITDEKESSGFEGVLRKVREIYRAYQLERRFTKDQILEAYLNTFRLGGQVAGIEAGANYYFGKRTRELTVAECAAIVSITKNPYKYDPFVFPQENKIQRDYVLSSMREMNFLTEQQYIESKAEADAFPFTTRYGSTRFANRDVWSYFTDTAVEEVIDDLEEMYQTQGYDTQKFASAKEAAVDLFYMGGLTVYLTVDLHVQAVVEDVALNGPVQSGNLIEGGIQYHDRKPIYENIPIDELEKDENGNPIYEINDVGEPITKRLAANQVQDAIVVMNFKGELKGVAGGIYAKEKSLVQNRAVQSTRQTGSSMKPLGAYCLPLEYDAITFSTGFVDQATEFYNGSEWPRNYDRTYRNAPVPVAVAIEQSLNTIAVQALKTVGVDITYEFLTNMLGISSLDPIKDKSLSPLALGGLTHGISPYEMAAAYAVFGGDGSFYEKHCYSKVTTARGESIIDKNESLVINRAISPQTAMIMNRLLQGVCLRGTATNAKPTGSNNPNNLPYAGKTGTTSDNNDYWMIGMNPYYVCTIWEGYDQPKWLSSPFAIKPIQKMFRTIMARISYDKEYLEFPTAEGVVTAAYCRDTGGLASGACGSTAVGYYKRGHLPAICNHQVAAPPAEEEPPA